VAPGRLFVVGDPKQSIYRFRRADISMFLQAKERFAPEGGGPVELCANFRTGAPIIEWVNAVFADLMHRPPDTDVPVPSQPAYGPLQAQRPAAPVGPAVAVVGVRPTDGSADDVRRVEARDVANAVTAALRDGWQVQDDDGWRPCRLGDITILVPARTSLPFLEDALQAAGVPFRAESSSIDYASRAVRDLMMVLRAADDPTDHHRIVAALRTPLLGCGDDDLYRHRVLEGRSWAYNGPEAPDAAAGPVSAGLAFLRAVHDARYWQSPAELLDRIARDRRALELGFAEGRPRDVWRRLRFVVDQARAWSEATGGSLRAYLHWVEQQTSEGVRVTESILPETDDDAVRIMTIHAAKGLEFPITVVSGLSTGSQGMPAMVDVAFPPDTDGVAYSMGKDVRTTEYEAWKPIDDQMGYDERIRLLYVACTRARDHLVVSLHHKARRTEPGTLGQRSNAELLRLGMGLHLDTLTDLSGTATPLTPTELGDPAPPAPFDTWQAERAAALATASRPGAVAATALTDEGTPDTGAASIPPMTVELGEPTAVADGAPVQQRLFDGAPAPGAADGDADAGLQKRPRDLDLPPWLKGRYGTAIGRAVHGVLQTADLTTGEGVDAAVAFQCMAEAIPDQEAQVRRLVADALASPSVRVAAASPHWREVYACAPIGDRLLEGYVDLLYRGSDGLVVVDYKTSATADDAALASRVQGYRLQGAAYAVAAGRATGEPVTQVVFVFLTPDGARERPLPDLPAAMADVERLVADGQELVVG
jgi:ATP-dependent exoDNAse (exonuclease V) beta subunit